ncbi:reverse transcriptase domain-containing protein [Desulfobacca acetoxidans]|uniref:RNA-directed DNA polymerase n=1 Tax=Desulfobacca acetoxidans (strain ATCC 700848 / DSM 11109 / ASRB2) TaxID=880072 RepID=F2NCL6_DESAR|nr:reverse transcriptase domain-containing protein [Desulfobacca acetoxidans]AEB09150.1 RNA-directed DNA polymerase (Reverse transcriptase) [Desulfobacca acetoxidans DSM 11109]
MISEITVTSNLHHAFTRVEASQGMPGVDGVSLGGFKEDLAVNLAILGEELRSGEYAPLPLLRFLVAKRDGSPRPLSVPTVRDRVAQAAVLNSIEPIFEAQFEEVSFAYRKGRSVRQAAYRIKELRDQGYRFVVDADLDAFFDNINHELLLAKVANIITDPDILRLIGLWVQAEVYDGEKIYMMEKGIPQGAVISPVLANLFLDELDEGLIRKGYALVRYADDFVILARTRPEAEAAMAFTEEILEKMNLALDMEDTEITDFKRGFTYLGLIFAGEAILAPFDRPKRERKVLYMPPPFDLEKYFAGREKLKVKGNDNIDV